MALEEQMCFDIFSKHVFFIARMVGENMNENIDGFCSI